MADQEFVFADIFSRARHRGKKQAPYVRTIPKMPGRLWRVWAVAVTVLGAAVAFAIWARIGAAVGGAILGFAAGMYIVETRWVTRHGNGDDG